MEKDFQVRNEDIERRLRVLGERVKTDVPKGWGFTLMMFDYSAKEEGGGMFYISSAQRGDMIKAMQEFISKNGVSNS